jgi:hypothetical protein
LHHDILFESSHLHEEQGGPAAQAASGLRHPVILVPGDGGSQVRNIPAQYLLSCIIFGLYIHGPFSCAFGDVVRKVFCFCVFSKTASPNCLHCLRYENGEL